MLRTSFVALSISIRQTRGPLLAALLLFLVCPSAVASPRTYTLEIDPTVSVVHTSGGWGLDSIDPMSGSFQITLDPDPFSSNAQSGSLQLTNIDVMPAGFPGGEPGFGFCSIGFIFPVYAATYERMDELTIVHNRLTFQRSVLFEGDSSQVDGFPGGGIGYLGSFDGSQIRMTGTHYDGWPYCQVFDGGSYAFDLTARVMGPPLQPGDANVDQSFDQQDIVRVLQSGKYPTGQAATWGEGDWNGGPGGYPGEPPEGDGLFNQLDIVAAQQAGTYLTGRMRQLPRAGRSATNKPRSLTTQLQVRSPLTCRSRRAGYCCRRQL